MDDLSIFNKLFTQNNFSYLLKNKAVFSTSSD